MDNIHLIYLAIIATTICYMVYGKYKQMSNSHTTDFNQTRVQENETLVSSSSRQPQNWEYNVFVSFRGADVRKGFLSHLLNGFKRKGIDPFIDSEMKRGASISPELERAIEGSRIKIVLLSENYASSSWCLDELVKILEYRKNLDHKVITIFYQVEPTDVKKQTGEFGKVFKRTCKGRTRKVTQKWKEALAEVGTIAGYESSTWVDEAAIIENISTDISERLNHLAPSQDLKRFIGMKAHMDKMQSLLRFDLVDEVRIIGIWGPLGIGKSTICRCLFNEYSSNFPFKTIMVNIKQNYPNPCFDEGSAQLQLQNDMLSKTINHKDMAITHLGVARERLKDKKVLLILDDVNQLAQLSALAGDKSWFGPGSRIIIATEDPDLLHAHRIETDCVYDVEYPSDDEAFQIFRMYARPKNPLDDGFIELVRPITNRAYNLPRELQEMGSRVLQRRKDEWIPELLKWGSPLPNKTKSKLIVSMAFYWICSSSPDQSKNWEHAVFTSFCGEDVHTSFLSLVLKEFKRKRITPFIDNEMEKRAISVELILAIRKSKIAIVLLSKNYASSSKRLNILVKIMKSRRNIGQTVIPIYYQVEPIDVRRQAGEFGMVFEETCKGETSNVIKRYWREALTEVANIVGYKSNNWVDEDHEVTEIGEVVNDISYMLQSIIWPPHNRWTVSL